jgi:transcriptional regulator of acetoin/glycerol metabolism
LNALRRNDFNRLEAARSLGMHKSTFFRKIRRLGIELPAQDGRAALGDKNVK